MMMNYENIPEEMKQLKHWGVYKLTPQSGKHKFKKKPFKYDGTAGRSNDPSTWCDFQTAFEGMKKLNFDGLAFYFGDDYVGIDLDDVESEINNYINGDRSDDNIVAEFIKETDSYTETSVSGNGIHIIVKATVPGTRRRRGDIEIYPNGRFFALTGNVFGQAKGINTADITKLYKKYLEPQSNVIHLNSEPRRTAINDLSTKEVIETALKSKTAIRFEALLNGKWEGLYNSQSDADMAFANDLAFWTAKDFSKMDEIFRSSGLYREKYDSKRGKTTYGESLLRKAISETADSYEPPSEEQFQLFLKQNGDDEQPTKKKKSYSYDDTGNSERFFDTYGKIVKYDPSEKNFYFFDGTVWKIDKTMMIEKLVNQTIESIKNEPLITSPGVEEEDAMDLRNKFIKRSRQHSGKNGMIGEIQPLVADDFEKYDQKNGVINTQSGMVDLSTGELRLTQPSDKVTKITAYEYSGTAEAPLWDKFLNQIFLGDQELIHFVQKCIGYAIMGTADEQLFFILHGNEKANKANGSNGKSVFLNTLNRILGSYSDVIASESLLLDKWGSASSGPKPEIAKMKGLRLVTTSETEYDAVLSEAQIKNLTGSENISARKLNANPITFKPTATIFMSTNNKPLVRGTDNGIWRRLVTIPFFAAIPNEKQDIHLTDKLFREAPGILNWAVEGSLMYQREGLKTSYPEAVKSNMLAYRNEMDTIGQFLSDRCTFNDAFEVNFKELSDAFRDWQYIYGTNMSIQKFGRELSKRYEKRKSSGNVLYTGLKLASNEFKKPGLKIQY